MKIALLLLVLSAATCLAEPEPSIANGLRAMDAKWQEIEPGLFAPGAPKKYDAFVRCSGSPVSLRDPVVIKLASGITVRLTKLQGADREFLGSFRKPPSTVTVWGPILAVDPATRTITINAVSTMFEQ